jgi:hypothetical protein
LRRISFSAASAAATAPAASSAFTLWVTPWESTPRGAITGTKPASATEAIGVGSTSTTLPTRPRSRSSSSIWVTRIMSPSVPVRPMARPPPCWISETISRFTLPPSTISTTSMVSSSVTRSPSTKVVCLPSRSRVAPICGPPPCTITGRRPMYFSRTTSTAKEHRSSASLMALPPYLITTVLS